MSDELLKVNDDLWCLWSHVADGPKVWGGRDEVYGWMVAHEDERMRAAVAERFDRAEANGTSMRDEPRPTGFIYDQRGWLPWERLEAFLVSYQDRDHRGADFDLSLLDPFEDDEATGEPKGTA